MSSRRPILISAEEAENFVQRARAQMAQMESRLEQLGCGKPIRQAARASLLSSEVELQIRSAIDTYLKSALACARVTATGTATPRGIAAARNRRQRI